MPDKQLTDNEWFVIMVIAFMGGVVSNIILPLRRGLWGFAGAALIGVFCGGVSGIIANSFNAPVGTQYLVAASISVLGDRLLSAILTARASREHYTIHTTVNGNLQQNVNQEGGNAKQDI